MVFLKRARYLYIWAFLHKSESVAPRTLHTHLYKKITCIACVLCIVVLVWYPGDSVESFIFIAYQLFIKLPIIDTFLPIFVNLKPDIKNMEIFTKVKKWHTNDIQKRHIVPNQWTCPHLKRINKSYKTW